MLGPLHSQKVKVRWLDGKYEGQKNVTPRREIVA
jgi:hypothetical protein